MANAKDPDIIIDPSIRLTPFEGLEVVAAAVEIPNAAGGLRDPLRLEPQEFHQGQRVSVALDCVVGKVRFEPVKKDDPYGAQRRVHVFTAEAAAIVDSGIVGPAIEAQREKIELAREEARGVQRFDFSIPADDEDGGEQGRRVRLWLGGMKRGQLRELCDEFGVPYSDRTTATNLVEALVEHAPMIAERFAPDDETDGDESVDDGEDEPD